MGMLKQDDVPSDWSTLLAGADYRDDLCSANTTSGRREALANCSSAEQVEQVGAVAYWCHDAPAAVLPDDRPNLSKRLRPSDFSPSRSGVRRSSLSSSPTKPARRHRCTELSRYSSIRVIP